MMGYLKSQFARILPLPNFSTNGSKWHPLLEEVQLIKDSGVTVWSYCPLVAAAFGRPQQEIVSS